MYLIVGLGNPDKVYENTFHNIGFMAIDRLAQKLGVTFSKNECKAKTAHTFIGGTKVILAKPQTYMNLSGESVISLTSKYKIEQDKNAFEIWTKEWICLLRVEFCGFLLVFWWFYDIIE